MRLSPESSPAPVPSRRACLLCLGLVCCRQLPAAAICFPCNEQSHCSPNPARLRPFSGQVRRPMAGSAVACSSVAAPVPATPCFARSCAAAPASSCVRRTSEDTLLPLVFVDPVQSTARSTPSVGCEPLQGLAQRCCLHPAQLQIRALAHGFGFVPEL
nr:uncharacterized protein LOC120976163 [Aegilops tauschii subsp. strangulata]